VKGRTPRIEACAHASLALLRRNLVPQGVLAATRNAASEARRYTRIFGRDAALCALAMFDSGDPVLVEGAVASLQSLAAQQAANGQIPKYVDPVQQDADFWYLGCIDATLWWLVAVDEARRHRCVPPAQWEHEVARAIAWLQAQEHPAFALLQQNEASDWADIMPRSGYVLYTNALWHDVKRRYALPGIETTAYHFNHLFHPFQRDLPVYHRARLLSHYVRRGRADPGLYLSFVNFAVAGDEGDVFGNLLAVLCGPTSESMGQRIAKTLLAAAVDQPWPVRVTLHPLARKHELWRPYMGRHQQNHPHQYHNGGAWPFVGGFWVMALARLRPRPAAWLALERLAEANEADGWRFTEWFHGRTGKAMGMAGQTWNAATFWLALRMLEGEPGPWGRALPGAGGG
jgi:hypothetical protein